VLPDVPSPSVDVAVGAEPLSIDRAMAAVGDPRAGAVVVFSGVTRDVPELWYEAYVEMAERELRRIAEEAVAQHGLCAAVALHRTGRVPLSEPSVVVAASAPHRDAAFAGARALIDRIKEQAPVWKKEAGAWKHTAVPQVPPPRTPGADAHGG
jgi:molybdopterin synthase catalytic subunit